MKTKFLKSVAGFALLASAFAHAADPYPNKTITMIVPFAAGGQLIPWRVWLRNR